MTKLSVIIQHAEFAANKKARLANIVTGFGGHYIFVTFTDGATKGMHSDEPVEIDWVFDPAVATAQRRIWDEIK